MKPHETLTHKGVTIEIHQDSDPSNPRKEFDHVGEMVCFHSRYNLGDKHDFNSPDEFREWWKANGDGGVLLPLYLYDHSGITMSTGPFSCPWDSGQVGWIYVTKQTILKEWGAQKRVSKLAREKAERYLESEVKEYDQYLTGDVFGYIIDPDGDNEESCWGFYGFDYCVKEAKSMAEHVAKRKQEEKAEAELMACRDIVTA